MTKPEHTDQKNEDQARWERETRESEKIAYTEVPTQNEMLQYTAQNQKEKRAEPGSDKTVTRELDAFLYEAAQEGNIGGG